MTKRQRYTRTKGKRKDYGKSDFPEAEAIVYEQFLQWRKMKYQVPLLWFSKRRAMKLDYNHVMIQRLSRWRGPLKNIRLTSLGQYAPKNERK